MAGQWYIETCPDSPGCVLELADSHVDLGKHNLRQPIKLCAFHAAMRAGGVSDRDLYQHIIRKHIGRSFSTAAVAAVLDMAHADVAWVMEGKDGVETVRISLAGSRANQARRRMKAAAEEGRFEVVLPIPVEAGEAAQAQVAVDLAVGPGKAVVE